MTRVVVALPFAFSPAVARAHVTDPEIRPALDPTTPPPEPPAPEAPVNLFPRLPMARTAGWFLPPEPLPSGDEEQAEARLDEYFDERLGRDRLDVGQVDGWYFDLGRAMRQEFRPNQAEIEAERRAGMTLLQLLYDEMRRYGNGPERPIDVPGQTLPEQRGALTHDPTDRASAVQQERFDWFNPLNAPVTWYRVDLRVTHNPEGELSAAWVLRSSGLRTLDQAALDAARTGGVHRPEIPDAVFGDRQAVRSDWAFEFGDVATFWAELDPTSIIPNIQGACVLDDHHGENQCAVLGRGIVRTRVRLLRVVDATHLTPEEQRAARRRDPDRSRP